MIEATGEPGGQRSSQATISPVKAREPEHRRPLFQEDASRFAGTGRERGVGKGRSLGGGVAMFSSGVWLTSGHCCKRARVRLLWDYLPVA